MSPAPKPSPKPRANPDEQSFSWKCRSCSSVNTSGFACRKCAAPHIVEDLSVEYLRRNNLTTADLWMCIQCKSTMPFDCGTCFKCHSTNSDYCIENWRCRFCSKGHRSSNSLPCCDRFERPRVPYSLPWKCPCGSSNPIVSTRCFLCHRPQPTVTVLPKDWICRCGLITEFFRDVCTCGQTKETGKVAIWRNMSDTVVQNWRCEKCDIVNGKLMGLCRKCGEARGDADLEWIEDVQ